jgi:hypothetical protein
MGLAQTKVCGYHQPYNSNGIVTVDSGFRLRYSKRFVHTLQKWNLSSGELNYAVCCTSSHRNASPQLVTQNSSSESITFIPGWVQESNCNYQVDSNLRYAVAICTFLTIEFTQTKVCGYHQPYNSYGIVTVDSGFKLRYDEAICTYLTK